MRLSEINIYPVKSFGGLSLTESAVQFRGLAGDRRWMWVDSAGDFVTQRECPHFARVQTTLSAFALELSYDGQHYRLEDPYREDGPRKRVTVWGDEVEAVLLPADVNEWLSSVLGIQGQLVYMPETSRRAVEATYARSPSDHVSFADGYPILLISEASLEALNQKLETPVLMNRFRPNLVVTGTEPFEEDGWREIEVDGLRFAVVKPCARCTMTTIDQASGERGKEPLKTLASFRTLKNKVLFGQNLIPLQEGIIRQHSSIVVVS